VLYQVVRDHYETFAAQASSWCDGAGLPPFIEKEFRGFLRCGWLAGGFARFHCDRCQLDRLVPFSCKGRAVCPSCGGRRMAERAAHLVDQVLPDVPVRQWVLSLPHRVRYLLAWDHALCRAVAGVFMRAVLGFLRRRARAHGVADGRSGAVVVIQRFGAALNVNVHAHALVLDGVFAQDDCGGLSFHPAAPPTEAEMDVLVRTIARRVERLLVRRGVWGEASESGGSDPWVAEEPLLAGFTAASVRGRVALGPRPGAALRRVGGLPDQEALPIVRGPHQAALRGFDLDATVVVPADGRERLERLCRYALRPPIAQDRIEWTAGGEVLLELRHRWSDGTTHLRFHPLELLERLASLTPRPRINLVLYYGVLAAHAAWRTRLPRPATPALARAADSGERRGPPDPVGPEQAMPSAVRESSRKSAGSNWLWAQLMRRSFGFDVLACPRCGGRFRLVALIEERSVIDRILRHLGLPAEVPATRPSRAPPASPHQVRFDDDAA